MNVLNPDEAYNEEPKTYIDRLRELEKFIEILENKIEKLEKGSEKEENIRINLDCDCKGTLFEINGIAEVNATITENGHVIRTYDEYDGDLGISVLHARWHSIKCLDCDAKNEEINGWLDWLKVMK